MGQPRKNRLSVKFFSYATFRGRPPPFPKRITLLFSVTKILTAVFLIWGNPEKTAFPSSFSLMLLSGATPELPKADYFPCSPRSFWRNKFLRQVAHTLPKANYPLVFRSQNSYRCSFLIWGNPEKTAFPSSFPLMLLSGSPHTSRSGLPSCFPFPKFLPPFFFDLGQPRKKPPFRQVFLLCYFRESPHTSRSGLPSCFPFPKFLPPFFFDLGQPRKNRLSVKFSSYATFGGDPAFQAGSPP